MVKPMFSQFTSVQTAAAVFLASLTLIFPALCHSQGSADGRDVSYTVDGQSYEGYFVPATDSRGLVLLIHDWDGLTAYEKRRADMLADEGYSVFAVDLFGEGIRPEKVEDRRQHTGELYRDRDKMRAIMRGALTAAGGEGADTRATASVVQRFSSLRDQARRCAVSPAFTAVSVRLRARVTAMSPARFVSITAPLTLR